MAGNVMLGPLDGERAGEYVDGADLTASSRPWPPPHHPSEVAPCRYRWSRDHAESIAAGPRGLRRSADAGHPVAGREALVTSRVVDATQPKFGAPASRVRRRPQPVPPFELDESKLDPPLLRTASSFAVRSSSVSSRTVRPAVLAVVAPAGYGKTTLLAQWAERKRPRLVWLSVDDRDNDPTVLLTHLAVALDRVERIDPTVFRSVASPGARHGRRRAAGRRRSRRCTAPVAIVLDHAEALTNRACRDLVAELALRLPPVRSWRSDRDGRCRCRCRSCGPGAASRRSGSTTSR